jgi:RNA polymerase sigma factor (sigma-70 family)
VTVSDPPQSSARVAPSRVRRAAALPPFERVVEQHGPALLRFATAQGGPERAEDVFQETMLSALRAYDRVREPASIRSWLFAIAARKAIDVHRERARSPQPVPDLERSAAAEGATAVDEPVWELLRGLPDKQRQAVALRYVGDLSHREIARVMETSEAAARRNVFEGLRQLRARLRLPAPSDRKDDRP